MFFYFNVNRRSISMTDVLHQQVFYNTNLENLRNIIKTPTILYNILCSINLDSTDARIKIIAYATYVRRLLSTKNLRYNLQKTFFFSYEVGVISMLSGFILCETTCCPCIIIIYNIFFFFSICFGFFF